jgi:capsular exopolysaccharide synthesis family protein
MLEGLRARARAYSPRRAADAELGEAYRIIRTNLMVALEGIDNPVVLFTSANEGEGKSSTVANLAPVMALASQRVVVVDVDLRNPDVHHAFGLPNERGFADVVRGDAELDECLQYVGLKTPDGEPERGLYVLTSGPPPANPAELLSSRRAARLFEALAGQADIVLVDSPPVLAVADSLVLARLVSGVVLVVEARRTPIPAIKQAKDALTRNQARLLGLVVSKVQASDMANSEFGSTGSYGYAYG